ncbi:hypothetical protein OHA40_23395 [Nocardia sp. NBC_00508]|uniref:hypothetical protein n=1 Tax=Nocardia sp. NBC_00508 TaxID=2975992 RepID=UPI002E812181|nr:hypothetical protein [Nocardia sp. NBC_00508]WUD64615.1 hypothetical protein OHA40_23395 [Nocardia sp. NBC_00508]
MTGARIIDSRTRLTRTQRASDPIHPDRTAHRSPHPEDPVVHRAISLHGIRFDFAACLSSALEFVNEQQAHRYADDVTIDLHDTHTYPCLPNERLYVQP